MRYLCLVFEPIGGGIGCHLVRRGSYASIAGKAAGSARTDPPTTEPGPGAGAAVVTPLQPGGTTTVLRPRNGRFDVDVDVTPPSEPADQLVAFVIVDARDLNDAIRIVSTAVRPGAGRVEVRAVDETR